MDEILCCLAILRMAVCRFFCLTEMPQDGLQAADHKGLESVHKRLKGDSALQAVQQGWKDDAVKDPNLGAGLDLASMP